MIRLKQRQMLAKVVEEQKLLTLASMYGEALQKYRDLLDEAGLVSGLDEWNPRRVDWENQIFDAEELKNKAKDRLLRESHRLYKQRIKKKRTRR